MSMDVLRNSGIFAAKDALDFGLNGLDYPYHSTKCVL